MRMNMIGVAVCRYHHLMLRPCAFRKLNRNLMRERGRDIFLGLKALGVLVEIYTVCFVKTLLRRHEFSVRILPVTVDPCDISAIGIGIGDLEILFAIVDDVLHSRGVLRMPGDISQRRHR